VSFSLWQNKKEDILKNVFAQKNVIVVQKKTFFVSSQITDTFIKISIVIHKRKSKFGVTFLGELN